jgi:hypothetical protein
LETGVSQFEESGLDAAPQVSIGYSFQDDLLTNRAVGWVGDSALRLSFFDQPLDDGTLSGDREEIDLGTRLYLDSGSTLFQPYVGFGGTLQRMHLEFEGTPASTIAPGAYGVVGFDVVLGRLRLGAAYRHTAGIDARLGDDEKTNLDGGAVMLSVGVSL